MKYTNYLYFALLLLLASSCESIFDKDEDITSSTLKVSDAFLLPNQKGYYVLSDNTGAILSEGALENNNSYELVVDTVNEEVHFTYMISTLDAIYHDNRSILFNTIAFFPKTGGVYKLDFHHNYSTELYYKQKKMHDDLNTQQTIVNKIRTPNANANPISTHGFSLDNGIWSNHRNYQGFLSDVIGPFFPKPTSSGAERFLMYRIDRYKESARDIEFAEVSLRQGADTSVEYTKDATSFRYITIENEQRKASTAELSIYNPNPNYTLFDPDSYSLHAKADYLTVQRTYSTSSSSGSPYKIWYPHKWLNNFKYDRYRVEFSDRFKKRYYYYIGYFPIKNSIQSRFAGRDMPYSVRGSVRAGTLGIASSATDNGLATITARNSNYTWKISFVPKQGGYQVILPSSWSWSSHMIDYLDLSTYELNQFSLSARRYEYSDVKKYSNEQYAKDLFIDYKSHIEKEVEEGNYWVLID